MDIGEQKRVIQIEPEPLRRPEFRPDPAEPLPEPSPAAEPEPAVVPAGPPGGAAVLEAARRNGPPHRGARRIAGRGPTRRPKRRC